MVLTPGFLVDLDNDPATSRATAMQGRERSSAIRFDAVNSLGGENCQKALQGLCF